MSTEQLEELPLGAPSPSCFCRNLQEKDLKLAFGKSGNVIAMSCKQIYSSDVHAKVSEPHGMNATGQKSKVGSPECQEDCVEFRPYVSHKGL